MNMNFDENIMSSSSEMEDFIQQQQLGLPESLLFYLKKNSNSRLLLKFMQISKYFCLKEFPFFVVADLIFDQNEWLYRDRKHSFEYKNLDLENLTKPIWITNTLKCYTDSDDSKLISRRLPKIAVCDIVDLRLEDQILTWDEFKILVSSGNIEIFSFRFCHVEYDHGEIVPVEKIIELLPMVEEFEWSLNPEVASTITPETAKNIVNFLNPSILSLFRLRNIPEAFDFMTFAKFMDANPSTSYDLEFGVSIPPEYSKMVQEYVDKLLEDAHSQYRPIQLRFPRQTAISAYGLYSLYQIFLISQE